MWSPTLAWCHQKGRSFRVVVENLTQSAIMPRLIAAGKWRMIQSWPGMKQSIKRSCWESVKKIRHANASKRAQFLLLYSAQEKRFFWPEPFPSMSAWLIRCGKIKGWPLYWSHVGSLTVIFSLDSSWWTFTAWGSRTLFAMRIFPCRGTKRNCSAKYTGRKGLWRARFLWHMR